MTNDPQNIETYKALEPADVQSYLRAKAWHHVEDIGIAGQRWEWPADPEKDVILALRPESGEYGQRMAELVRAVAEVEGRSRAQVLDSILSASCDVVRVRLGGGAELPLKQGVEAIDALPKLLLAAAQAERRPSAYYASRLPNAVKAYMETLTLKQTEVGSFVLRIASPLGEQASLITPPVEGELLHERPPLGRRVITTLACGVAAAAQAAEEATREQRLDPLERAVTRGVSANLLDALATFGEASEGSFAVELDWAPALEAPGLPCRVAFECSWTSTLRKAASSLREQSERPRPVRLTGPVYRLEERSAGEGERPRVGTIHLWAPLGEKPCSVEAELSGAAYNLAVAAHAQAKPIRLHGTLEQQSRKWFLRDAHGVEFWSEQDDEDGESGEDDF